MEQHTTTSEEISTLARRTHANAMMFGMSRNDEASPGTGPALIIVNRHDDKLQSMLIRLPNVIWDQGIATALDSIQPARMEACFVAIGLTVEAWMRTRDGRKIASRITAYLSVDDHWAMIVESENDAFPELMNDTSAEANHDHYLTFTRSEATLALRNLVGRCVAVIEDECEHTHPPRD